MSPATASSRQLRHFLIVFDLAGQKLESVREFDDLEDAAAEYARLEEEHGKRMQREIVLISAGSLATVKRTHSRYFSRAEVGAPF